VVLDEGNPRSVAFQAGRLLEHLTSLPGPQREGALSRPDASIRLLASSIAVTEAADVGEAWLRQVETKLLALSDEVTARYFGQGEAEVDAVESLG